MLWFLYAGLSLILYLSIYLSLTHTQTFPFLILIPTFFSSHFPIVSVLVMPGFIRNTARYLLRDCPNTTVNYNPAFVAQGDILKGYVTGGYFGMVLIGAENDDSASRLSEVYTALARGSASPPSLCRMSAESAEITKLASNCFRTIKISFAFRRLSSLFSVSSPLLTSP